MDKSHKSNWARYALFLSAIAFLMAGWMQKPSSAAVTSHEVSVEVSETKAEIKPEPVSHPSPPTQNTIKGLSLNIPSIGINIPLTKTTLGKNRELLVPVDPNQAAWYARGPVPGNPGTALITGHYDANGGKAGVFYNLKNLKTNDLIRVSRDDGKVAVFKVEKLASYRQDNSFPWSEVYSTSGPSALRIITCDGKFNPKTSRYSHNLVVYASLASLN